MYFSGSRGEWNEVFIESEGNLPLFNGAAIHYDAGAVILGASCGNGLITAREVGTAYITASLRDGKAAAVLQLNVLDKIR